jgi:Leucine-rich repeat (LRR) protein
LPQQDLIDFSSQSLSSIFPEKKVVGFEMQSVRGKKVVVFEMRSTMFKRIDELKPQVQLFIFNISSYKLCCKLPSSLFIPSFSLQDYFNNMTSMEFSDCKFLRKFPDMSNIPNLEKLTIENCTNLTEVHHSIGFLDNLVSLTISQCSKLESLPRIMKLRSLQYLDLEGCSTLQNFPEIECQMESLRCINLGHTALKELPSSIRYITRLTDLNLEGCKNLMSLPSTIHLLEDLKTLILADCKKLEEILELPPDIEVVNAAGCISLERFPEVLKRFDGNTCDLPGLVYVDLSRCHKLLENMENDVQKFFSVKVYLSLTLVLICLCLDL